MSKCPGQSSANEELFSMERDDIALGEILSYFCKFATVNSSKKGIARKMKAPRVQYTLFLSPSFLVD